MNEVVITALPHPITTFVLGIMVVFMVVTISIMLYANKNFSKLIQEHEDLKKQIEEHTKENDKKIFEISRKVDSRIDKAFGTSKK